MGLVVSNANYIFLGNWANGLIFMHKVFNARVMHVKAIISKSVTGPRPENDR